MANNPESFQTQFMHDSCIISNNRGEIVAIVRFCAFSVSALIERDDFMPVFGQQRGYQIPNAQGRGQSMQQEQRMPLRSRCCRHPATIMEAQVVDRDELVSWQHRHMQQSPSPILVRVCTGSVTTISYHVITFPCSGPTFTGCLLGEWRRE